MNFKLESRQDSLVIHCEANLEEKGLPDLMGIIRQAVDHVVNGQSGPIIFDFKNTASVDRTFLNNLLPLTQQLSAKYKSFYAINVPPKTAEALQAAKLKHPIRLVASIAQAIEHAHSPTDLIANAELILAFQEGVVESFKNVASDLKVNAGKPFLRTKANAIATDMCATTEIDGKKASVTFALCFTEKVFLAILGVMHGENYTTFTPEMDDGALELVNIISSVSKKRMFEGGYVLKKQIPTSVKGSLIDKLFAVASCVIIIPFETDFGAFHIQFGVSYR